VVDEAHYASLIRYGFSCQKVGSPQECGNGRALACLIDWSQFQDTYTRFIDIDDILTRELLALEAELE